MKTILLALLLPLLSIGATAGDFTRNLPDRALLNQLTPEHFKNQDAIIILKEQALTIEQATIHYRGIELEGLAMKRAKIVVAKILTEAGATRYGSFEYTYREWWGDEVRSGFDVHVRILKEDGSIAVMPEEDVRNIVSRENTSGQAIERKVLFKVTDLKAGDVIQIEYFHFEPFVRSASGVFFYNDRDIVLFSNLAITLPADDQVHFFSFPEPRIGQPTVSQMAQSYGAGQTYFWSVKNLNALPDEAYSHPFADQSLMTAFVADLRAESGRRKVTDWNSITEDYVNDHIGKDKIGAAEITALGFQPLETSVTMDKVDRLYESIRRAIVLRDRNSIYPLSDNIDLIFEKKTGDASDLAYIMYTILKQWEQNANVVWIRDRREGVYEQTVPTVSWFDRMGVIVKIGTEEKVYDFDRSIPAKYDMPWFLSGISVPVLAPTGCEHKPLQDKMSVLDHFIKERHALRFTSSMALQDTMVLEYKGSAAETFRKQSYEEDQEELQARLRDLASEHCLASTDSAWCNQVLVEPVTEMHFAGKPKSQPTQLESFITLRPNNHSLEDFYEHTVTATRVNDVVLHEPFMMSVAWNLAVPKGYALQQCPEECVVSGPCGMNGLVKVTKAASSLDIVMEMRMPTITVPQPSYKEMVAFLDKMKSAIGKDIVLQKAPSTAQGKK